MSRRTAAAVLLSLSFAAAPAGAGEVARWNQVATDAALAEQIDPLNESRIFAIVHASIHDALNAVERHYESHGSRLSAAPGASAW